MNFWEQDDPDRFHLDYETFSPADLTDVGTSAYARHEDTEILIAAYAFRDEPVKLWLPAEGEEMPAEFEDRMADDRVMKAAFNDPFEKEMSRHVLGLECNERSWFDTMVLALSCSLPGSLDKAAKAVGVPAELEKDADGKRLMKKFSIPRRPTKKDPRIRTLWHEDFDEWKKYCAYGQRDVEAERALFRRVWKYRPPGFEFELRFLDQEINSRGLPINLNMVKNAITIYEEALGAVASKDQPAHGALGEMQDITGLDNPNSTKQLLPWLKERGYPYDDMKKGHVETALAYFDNPPDHWGDNQRAAYCDNPELRRAIELRLQTSRSSIKKYYALDRATDEDGFLRHVLQMNGAARTGRYAGRIFQPQNLPRPEKRLEPFQVHIAEAIEHLDREAIELIHGDVFDVLASAIRPAAQAPEGMIFVDADLSAIENRVLGWLSGCQKILEVFRLNRDPYISFATYLFNDSYDNLFHEYKVLKNGAKRTIAKPGTLGCGYQMGPGKVIENRTTGEIEGTGLLGYAWNMGVKSFTEEDSKHSVDVFRSEFKEVVNYWYDIERAAKRALKMKRRVNFGFIAFDVEGPFLVMILPSGRKLRYLRPRIEEVKTPWGSTKMQITYEGQNDKKQWVRQHTTPGKLTENADQAISRDLLTHGMMLAKQNGLDTRLHVHDQILALTETNRADDDLLILKQCMEEQPSWAPGLPLGSEGFTTRHFMKD